LGGEASSSWTGLILCSLCGWLGNCGFGRQVRVRASVYVRIDNM
jgi:hypothetical protein